MSALPDGVAPSIRAIDDVAERNLAKLERITGRDLRMCAEAGARDTGSFTAPSWRVGE